MADVRDSFNARQKYSHFRILVIGRANAGKTTLLKRVCNTTDDPRIYDEGRDLLEPTSARGVHDIDRPFAFESNPQFIFHDSPGFETGDGSQLKRVQAFIEKRAKSTEVNDQLHAIWFCFEPNLSRPLLDLEMRFFNEQQIGNVPVIAIFTKFDDLIKQTYNRNLGKAENRRVALDLLETKFRAPLAKFKFPPRAYLRLEKMQKDDGNHQDQVKELTEKTAGSLDDLAIKMLFVSVQQNNLELCIRYAVKYSSTTYNDMGRLVEDCLVWFRHAYHDDYEYGEMEVVGGRRVGLGIRRGGGRQVLVLGEQFDYNCKQTELFITTVFNMPSLAVFSGVLICLENSFWHRPTSVSFNESFQKAFKLYTEMDVGSKLETAFKDTGDPH